MTSLINQFRRLYTDDGKHDVDFTDREIALAEAQKRLANHTRELMRAAENLNRAAYAAGFPHETDGRVH